MTIDELKRAQDEFVEFAKFSVQKNNDIAPHSYVLMYRGNLEKLKDVGGDVELLSPMHYAWFKELKDHDVIGVIRFWQMTWKEKFGVLYHTIPEDKRALLEKLLAMGKVLKVDDEYMRLTRPLMEVLKCNEKDVTAIALRQMCEVCDAIAIVNVMTAWAGTAPSDADLDKYEEGDLEKDPESKEVLHVSIESLALTRTIIIPIHRRDSRSTKQRGTEKFKGWGLRQEMSSEKNPGLQGEGRFYGLLKPLKPAEAKA